MPECLREEDLKIVVDLDDEVSTLKDQIETNSHIPAQYLRLYIGKKEL